jgi:hypothetical protein
VDLNLKKSKKSLLSAEAVVKKAPKINVVNIKNRNIIFIVFVYLIFA